MQQQKKLQKWPTLHILIFLLERLGSLKPAGKLVAAVASNPEGEALAPCGRCRQLLIEAGGRELVVDGPGGPKSIVELLADPFTVEDLNERDRTI